VGGSVKVDRDDARFVANALDSRISGDRETLDLLASSSFVRLAGAAVRLKDLAADWPPAMIGALELETIAKYGAKAADGDAHPTLQVFVDKLRELAGEKPRALPRNRFERRAQAKVTLSRRARLAGLRPAGLPC
jgi:hypothetical protein